MEPPPAPHCHSKFVFRIVDDPLAVERSGACVAFLYVGSHNFSKTAWGYRFGKQKEFLRCNSLELGVFLSTKSSSEALKWKSSLPFDLAAHKYRTDDVPFSAHLHIGHGYSRADMTLKCKALLPHFVLLGFHDETEVMDALKQADGEGALAMKILQIKRHLG